MKFKMEIKMDNAAFSDAPGIELARILRAAADRAEQDTQSGTCMDANGNKVGAWTVTR